MNIFKKSTLIAVILSAVISCKNNTEKTKTESKTVEQSINSGDSTKSVPTFVGDYVSKSYTKRNEGYDWVAITESIIKRHQNLAKPRICKVLCFFRSSKHSILYHMLGQQIGQQNSHLKSVDLQN